MQIADWFCIFTDLFTDSSDFCSSISLRSSHSLAWCKPMGQSSGTVNMDKVFLVSSSFRAEAYTFSAKSRTLSSTSWREIFVNWRGISARSGANKKLNAKNVGSFYY